MKDFSADLDTVKASGVFDEAWYKEKHPDVAITGMDALYHYMWLGRRLGRRPNPDFDPEAYLAANPDLQRAGVDPIVHYARSGKREGRPLRILSDEEFVIQTFEASEFFNADWYRQSYGDQIGDLDPVLHYVRQGWKQGLDPSESFSTTGYLDAYRDIKSAGINPLAHFLRSGYREGRLPKPKQRARALNVPRMTPEETGTPDEILQYDAAPTTVHAIENERIAIHVHLFFTDLADAIIERLRNIRHPFTLLISVPADADPRFWHHYFLGKLPLLLDINVKPVSNHGRDVAPWVVAFAEDVKQSTIFCHIHSKQSHHNSAHRGWFRFLGHSIMGSVNVVDSILRMLTQDEQCAVVSPCYYWTLASQPNYGKNREVVEALYARLGGEAFPAECPDYPAGSFFWARTETLRPLLDLGITLDEFDTEGQQVDATLAHGIERIIGLLPTLTGRRLKMVTVDVAYDLVNYVNAQRTRIHLPYVPVTERSPIPTEGDKIALFTCVSGGYETVAEMVRAPQAADLFFYTDDAEADVPKGFERRVPNYIAPEAVRTARFVKMHPHVWFQEHDWAIWCDANLYFMGDLRCYVDKVRNAGADAGFIAHPARETLLEEANELIEKRIVKQREVTEAQIARYLKEEPGIMSSRLIETNFFVVRLSSPTIKKFFRIWWSELNRYSHRDQLAVNFAAQRSGLNWVNLMPEGYSARNWPDLLLFSHDAEQRQDIINMTKVKSDVT